MRDKVFASPGARGTDFEFNADVAAVFDDMVARSVPFYQEQQDMVRALCKKFHVPGTAVYDLGCSTATMLIGLCPHLEPAAHLIGYDNSVAMLDQARQKIKSAGFEGRIQTLYADLNADLAKVPLENASVVTMCWTLQFIRPLRRDNVLRWIYEGLAEDGALIVAEKVLTNTGPMNRLFIELYYDYKRRNGYCETEILRKREALENVLVPYRTDENVEIFQRNGFELVETFFQWFNFAGFLAVKKPAMRSRGRR